MQGGCQYEKINSKNSDATVLFRIGVPFRGQQNTATAFSASRRSKKRFPSVHDSVLLLLSLLCCYCKTKHAVWIFTHHFSTHLSIRLRVLRSVVCLKQRHFSFLVTEHNKSKKNKKSPVLINSPSPLRDLIYIHPSRRNSNISYPILIITHVCCPCINVPLRLETKQQYYPHLTSQICI